MVVREKRTKEWIWRMIQVKGSQGKKIRASGWNVDASGIALAD
jgi:hypothetical protein